MKWNDGVDNPILFHRRVVFAMLEQDRFLRVRRWLAAHRAGLSDFEMGEEAARLRQGAKEASRLVSRARRVLYPEPGKPISILSEN